MPESDNFTDNTTWWKRYVKQRLGQFLINTHMALGSDPAFDAGLLPPVLKNGEGYTRNIKNIEWSRNEAQMIDNGMNPQDVFLLRAYKKLPGMVGK